MGVLQLMEVIKTHAPSAIADVSSGELDGKTVAVDASITICQFLATGGGSINNMVIGLFHRTVKLLLCGVKPVFVFDGPPHELKAEELAKRDARFAGSPGSTRIRAQPEHVAACRNLMHLLGVPCVDGNHEGESMCASLTKTKLCEAVASEDLDVLPFGGQLLIRNLKANEGTKIYLEKVLECMELSHNEFIDLCILLGTDFIDKIPGIGRVNAVQLIQQHRTLECVLENLDRIKHPIPDGYLPRVAKVRNLFKETESVKDVVLRWPAPKSGELLEFVSEKHGGEVGSIRRQVDMLTATYESSATRSKVNEGMNMVSWFYN